MTEVEERIAKVIADHVLIGGTRWDGDRRTTYYTCQCGERCYWSFKGEDHSAHLARLIVGARVDAELVLLEAAHEAADELDEWDGHPSPVLGGVSPGGAVRHRVHDAAGVTIDECPVCSRG